MDIEIKKQILINLKEIIEVSQGSGCWKAMESNGNERYWDYVY